MIGITRRYYVPEPSGTRARLFRYEISRYDGRSETLIGELTMGEIVRPSFIPLFGVGCPLRLADGQASIECGVRPERRIVRVGDPPGGGDLPGLEREAEALARLLESAAPASGD